ncbi:hexosaminidase [Pseudarcicella hirudinis]|uniref:beta-N-acetylhexosaminidase n=1 Tax=Pseudarcicella hirudinis TaxID=1079859 RepID=A0A1I5YS42_9BACT|nr:family 20 glycosylhydrolase [Pseudarcicella hirudinis]SFQ47029.1 hexosaminidase [Pseudarcicella hirudinis]
MKKIIFTLFVLSSAVTLHAQTNPEITLLPVPKSISLQGGTFTLKSDFKVSVKANQTDSILYQAVNRAFQTLNRRTNLYFEQQRITYKDSSDNSTFIIRVKQKASVTLNQDESYQLKITGKDISLNAVTTTGALRGLETFLQLLQSNASGFSLPQLTIEDAPRFVWRGLMIDVARHFIPLDVVKRNIDAMAAVKMNILHLHLSDDEGFRVESKIFPELHKKGSYGEYYTQAQIRELVAYARQRGIIVVPEFDMPGHTTGFLAAYPQLASAPGPYEPGPRFKRSGKKLGLMDIMTLIQTTPTPAFDPSKESTYTFLDKFIGEMANLFPAPYLHIGADENNGVSWKNNPEIVAFMKKNKLEDTHALQAYFVKRVSQILQKHHKQTAGWEELLSKDLSKNVIVQVWSDSSYLRKAIKQGNPVIISKGFYLDLFMPASVHYNNGLIPSSAPSNILGGEAALWAEAVDKDNMETRAWPRTAAIAERLWSPSSVKDSEDLYLRLFSVSNQLDEIGLQHRSNYERGLRRLTGGEDIIPLKTLTDVLTPIKGYKKLFAKMTAPLSHTYQTAPLTRVSDIVFVDSEIKRSFRRTIGNYLNHKEANALQILQEQLAQWKENYPHLEALINRHAMGNEVAVHAKNLYEAAQIGLEILAKLKTNETLSPEWIKQKQEALNSLKKADGEVELAIIPEIEALLNQKLAPEPLDYPLF